MNISHPLPQQQLDSALAAGQRAFLALLAASATMLAGLLLFTLGIRLTNIGRALPGVTAAGISLGGMSQAEIELALGEALPYPESGRILLQDGDRQWVVKPAELGVIMDVPEMARRAIAVGRRGSLGDRLSEQYSAWYEGHRIAPIAIFDQRIGTQYLQGIAAEIDRAQLEATLSVEGVEVLMRPALTPAVSRLYDAAVPLVIQESPPLVIDASEQAELAREILSEPLALTVEGERTLVLQPAEMADIMEFQLTSTGSVGRYTVGLEAGALAARLEPLAPALGRDPENARFIFNDDTFELDLLQPAVIGRSLDVEATIQAIQAGLSAGEHEVPLVFDLTSPAVNDDATGEELGITENVVAVSTYFAGSSPERIHNIQTAAAAFHGYLLPPGESLSMAEVLGDISLDTGYAEALIIYGNRTIKGVGGGVCQVSTTLYRAAFNAGFPILERHPHAYRVLYYEQGRGSPGPGMDATVFVPMVDFRFTNDTPYWLLLETYIYGTQLLWKFYSTSDGRTVQWSSTGPMNVEEAPKPLYRENPDLEKGEIEQVDFEADGMDVVVERTVMRDGAILHDDTFKTHYLPWRAIYEYGPGTELPKDAKTE